VKPQKKKKKKKMCFENRSRREYLDLRGRGRLHNEELHTFYGSANIIMIIKSRNMRWTGHVACMGLRNAFAFIVGKPEKKRTLRRPNRRWEGNIKVILIVF
jgi:hypothetical protein